MTWKNPAWTVEKKAWFMRMIEGMVTRPDVANALTVHGRCDLEIAILVAPEDEHVFTDDVIAALTRITGAATGVFAPVIYLEGKPSAGVAEILRAAEMDV